MGWRPPSVPLERYLRKQLQDPAHRKYFKIERLRMRARMERYRVSSSCPHHSIEEGPRVPMLYGTGPTEVCTACGAYRITLHTKGPWRPGPPDMSERGDY